MIRNLHDAVAILCGISATLLAVVAGLVAWVYRLATRLDGLDDDSGRAIESIADDIEEHRERLERLEGERPTVPTCRGKSRF